MDIHWYPGHMAKAKRLLKENLKMVDVVIEVLDARIPSSSRNPDIDELAALKPRLVVLNKSDLADPDLTRRWKDVFLQSGFAAVAVDSVQGRGVREVPVLVQQLAAPKMASLVAAGRRPRSARCMVLGIPNVGKSFLINKLVGQRAARTGDKPGVTRGRQWIRLAGNLDLLDTPGILWAKLEDPEAAYRLAITGAIKEEVFDLNAVAGRLVTWLAQNYPDKLKERYKLEDLPSGEEKILKRIGMKRGFFVSGGVVDTLKSAVTVLKEFREGKLGRFTLEPPAPLT
ncbi:MAG: ribosome biogenesis GTPase YlqF [Peptococcaceae bacterium]|nr:ribosome biogenesis GTPase YlqF [Peptococcaceae bacterium]